MKDHGGTRALRFSRVQLGNWRNFKHVNVELQGRVFLVGPNASGKSNFLDVFRFLRDIVTVGGGFQAAVEARGGMKRVRCLAARERPEVTIEVAMHRDGGKRWGYSLTFGGGKREPATIREERVTRNGKSILDRPDADDAKDPARLAQTHLEQINANREFREVADFFKSVQYLHVVPQLVRDPERSVGREDDPYGGDFLERVAKTTQKTRRDRLSRILGVLRAAIPQFEKFELTRDAKGTPHLRAKYTHWRQPGAWQEEQDLSDGTLRLIGLLWAALEGGGPLLLEEPELSLHPEVVRRLAQIFAAMRRSTGRQALVR